MAARSLRKPCQTSARLPFPSEARTRPDVRSAWSRELLRRRPALAIECARIQMERAFIVARPHRPHFALAIGGESRSLMIAAAGEFDRSSAAPRQDAVGAIVVSQPGDRACAIGRDGERGIIVRDAGIGELFFHRQPLHSSVAIQHCERLPERHGGSGEFERSRRRFEPDAPAISSTRAQDQSFRNEPLHPLILPTGLAEFLARQQLIFKRAHLSVEFEFAAGIGPVGLREAPARERIERGSGHGD